MPIFCQNKIKCIVVTEILSFTLKNIKYFILRYFLLKINAGWSLNVFFLCVTHPSERENLKVETSFEL